MIPFFSIIIPTYNAAHTISQCLEKVVNQTFQDIEVIVIDGASSDGTIQILSNYNKSYKNIRWVSEKDNGIYDAMNKGVKKAKGRWLYFLGCDDEFYDYEVLKDVHDFIIKHNSEIVYGNVNSIRLGDNYDGIFDSFKIRGKNICHQAMFFKRSLIKKNKFNLKYKLLADWDFNLRCFLNPNILKAYYPRIIAKYGSSGASSTGSDQAFISDLPRLIKKYSNYNIRLKTLYFVRNTPLYKFLARLKQSLKKPLIS